jgi:hypothetical protein
VSSRYFLNGQAVIVHVDMKAPATVLAQKAKRGIAL